MARRSSTYIAPARVSRHLVDSVRPVGRVQDEGQTSVNSGVAGFLEMAAHPVLAVTYWFDTASQPDHPDPYPVTIRFTGRRVGVEGLLQPGDEFVYDEIVEQVIPGSGPISLTVQIRNINPGEWSVTARELGASRSTSRSSRRWAQKQTVHATSAAAPRGALSRLWHRWTPSVGPTESTDHIHTSLPLFERAPGIIPGIWVILVMIGMAVALAAQSWLIAHSHLVVGPALPLTLIAIAVGIVSAKAWYLVLYRRESGLKRWNGWCIQGFITGATVMAAIMLALWRVPAGVILNVTAPGLLFAMAIGRVGCFFAGCCGGPLTASRWGVWSCDRHVGGRRVPTQLMESSLASTLGVVTLLAVLNPGPAGGAFFIAALAAYTLGRQGILHLRAEPRKTRFGLPLAAAASVMVLVVAVTYIIFFAR